MAEELLPIPDTYKETINSLENHSANACTIIKNDVPMIFEDILINVFKKNLENNYYEKIYERIKYRRCRLCFVRNVVIK